MRTLQSTQQIDEDHNALLEGRFSRCILIVQTFDRPVKDSKYRAPLTVRTWPLLHIIGSALFTILSFCVSTT